MTVFDDYEPEDAWSVDDPVPEQIVNLRRRLALLLDSDDAYAGLPIEELDLFAAVLELLRARRLSVRNALRAEDLTTDIALVRERLRR